MDASKKKALFRAKLEARNKEKNKRIDSPLVRYNESDQPVCRLCQLVLTSESDWKAHQVSSKHQKAVDTLKANAATARLSRSDEPALEPQASPPTSSNTDFQNAAAHPSVSPMPVSSGSLPKDFFDNHQDLKRQRTGTASNKVTDTNLGTRMDRQRKGAEMQPDGKHTQSNIMDSDPKTGKGALPAGFFDNKDADLRARGVELVKPNSKEEYKEFEKLIQDDLKEVDNRMEEEEVDLIYDAAETIEVAESLEQKLYKEKVEMLRRKKIELKAARSASRKRVDEVSGMKTSKEESSTNDEEDDTDEIFTVDWRAQHL